MPLELPMRDRLADKISEERHAQTFALESIAGAASLAADAVRDRRIGALENPPMPPSSVLIDIILSVTFNVAIPLAIREVVALTLARVVGARRIQGTLKKVDRTNKVSDTASVLAAITSLSDYGNASPVGGRTFQPSKSPVHPVKSLDKDPSTTAYWRSLPDGYLDQGGIVNEVLVTPLDNRIRQAPNPQGADQNASQGLRAGDSPAVAVVKAASQFAFKQKYAVGRTFDRFDQMVRHESMTPVLGEVLEFYLDLMKTQTDKPINMDKLRYFFEACIWALMYPEPARETPEILDNNRLLGRNYPFIEDHDRQTFRRIGVPNELLEYWLRQLPHPSGDGLQTFAEFYVSAHARNFDSAFGPSAPKHSDLRDSNGNPLQGSGILIPDSARHAVLDYLPTLAHGMAAVESTLLKTFPMVYVIPQVR